MTYVGRFVFGSLECVCVMEMRRTTNCVKKEIISAAHYRIKIVQTRALCARLS